MAATWESQRHELAQMLFGDMPKEEFEGFVRGMGDVVTKIRAAIAMEGAQS